MVIARYHTREGWFLNNEEWEKIGYNRFSRSEGREYLTLHVSALAEHYDVLVVLEREDLGIRYKHERVSSYRIEEKVTILIKDVLRMER